MKSAKELYLRAILVQNDITFYHKQLSTVHHFGEKLRLITFCLTSLNIFRESLQDFSFMLKEEKSLSAKVKSIRSKLNFINHLRNKVSGHLDSEVVEKAVQWAPSLFNEGSKSNVDFHITLFRKSLLESAINSYLDSNGKQKEFQTEIDLFYPPNSTTFLNYLRDLNIFSIEWLGDFASCVKEKIKFSSDEEMFELARFAGLLDFNLKAKT